MGRSDVELREAISAAVAELTAAAGMDLEELTVRTGSGRGLVRVVIDRDGGVDTESVAALSRALSASLDAVDTDAWPSYTLEVTSRGVGAPLTAPRHFRRAAGRLATIVRGDGERLLVRIAGVDGASVIVFDGPDGVTPRTVAIGDIGSAALEVEFAAIPAPVRAALAAVAGEGSAVSEPAGEGEGTA